MPFEALSCPNCGSGDVQEVKPGTYFCNHCDFVFKHVDPTRVTVAPSFCDHGNLIELQCQICKTGMCYQQCDALVAWSRNKEAGIVRTQGFGYREHEQVYDRNVEGPFLSVGKLLMSLLPGRKDGLSHVCHGCVAKAVPVAAERISSGAMCQVIRCWSASAKRCPCCHGGFCGQCVPTLPRYKARGGLVNILAGDTPPYILAGSIFWSAKPRFDLCFRCVPEWMPKATALAVTICQQDYAGTLTRAGEDEFRIAAIPVRRKKQLEETERQKAAATRYASEISARVGELMVIGDTCNRAKEGYEIVDERDRVSPAAASEVIWAYPRKQPYFNVAW
jgi:hypothetical protein